MDVEAWVRHVFDHEREGDVPWYHRVEDVPEHPPADSVALLTALMREPVRYLASYSDRQIAEGLWFLVDPGNSSYARALLDRTVDLQARLDCIRAIPKLFAELLALRCLPELSHGSAAESNPLNTACYILDGPLPSMTVRRLFARATADVGHERDRGHG